MTNFLLSHIHRQQDALPVGLLAPPGDQTGPDFSLYLGVRMFEAAVSGPSTAIITEKPLVLNFSDPYFSFCRTPVDMDSTIDLFTGHFGYMPTQVILKNLHYMPNAKDWIFYFKNRSFRIVGTTYSAQFVHIMKALMPDCQFTTVWPWAFKDFSVQSGLPGSDDQLGIALDTYLHHGGFRTGSADTPSFPFGTEQRFVDDVVFYDIVRRNEIRNVDALLRMVHYYRGHIGTKQSFTKVKTLLDVNLDTVQDYARYLEDVFLFFFVPRYHSDLRPRRRDPHKVYCINSAFYVKPDGDAEAARESSEVLAENCVYIELRRREYDVYYFKNRYDVDFIAVKRQRPVLAIDVCYSDERDRTIKRHIKAMTDALHKTKLNDAIIITRSRYERVLVDHRSIRLVPLYRWLMNRY